MSTAASEARTSVEEILRHPRLTRPEVLELGRFSESELRKRIKAGEMPGPVDRRCRPHVFDRDAVLLALGVGGASADIEDDPWKVDPEAIERSRATMSRRRR